MLIQYKIYHATSLYTLQSNLLLERNQSNGFVLSPPLSCDKDLWEPFINEELTTAMESDNVVDKYAVCVKKSNVIVGYFPLGKDLLR